MPRFNPKKDERWWLTKARHRSLTNNLIKMKYETPKQKPDLDDLVFNICIVCAIIAVMVIVGFIIF